MKALCNAVANHLVAYEILYSYPALGSSPTLHPRDAYLSNVPSCGS